MFYLLQEQARYTSNMTPKDFLASLKHITIAVIDDTGRPWAVPVTLTKYHAGTVEWFSKKDAVHSKAIAANEEVMLTAFATKESEVGEFGLYARARAKKVLNMPGVARYRAEIYEAWYTDASHKKVQINIEDL